MNAEETAKLKHLAAAYAMERVTPFEDVTGLASALVRRYLFTFEDSLDRGAERLHVARVGRGRHGCQGALRRPRGRPVRRRDARPDSEL